MKFILAQQSRLIFSWKPNSESGQFQHLFQVYQSHKKQYSWTTVYTDISMSDYKGAAALFLSGALARCMFIPCPYRWHCCIAYSSFPFLFSFMPLSAFLSAVNVLIKDHSLLTPYFSSLHLKPAEPSFSMWDPLINFKPQTINTKVTMSL